MMSRSSLLKNLSRPLIQPFAEFFRLEAASGILLLISRVSALALANSNVGIARYFPKVWDCVLAVSGGTGRRAGIRQAMLFLVAALGGMLLPARLFWLVNRHLPTAGGWCIPMATDMALALTIVTLLGERVPLALKVFMTALAIVDDLGAVLVIGFFYIPAIDSHYLLSAGGQGLTLFLFNWLGVRIQGLYLLLGLVLWYLTLKLGIHAPLAGIR